MPLFRAQIQGVQESVRSQVHRDSKGVQVPQDLVLQEALPETGVQRKGDWSQTKGTKREDRKEGRQQEDESREGRLGFRIDKIVHLPLSLMLGICALSVVV